MTNRVLTEMYNLLTEPFKKEEVAVALKQMDPLKSPDLDGFNPNFYQSYWHIVCEEVISVVLNF